MCIRKIKPVNILSLISRELEWDGKGAAENHCSQ